MEDPGIFPIGFAAAERVFNAEFYVANLELAGLSLTDQDGDGDIDNDDAVLDYFGAGGGLAQGRIASPIQARSFVGGIERSAFDESFYLIAIPAAERERIEAGEFASALDHYILEGAARDTVNGSGGEQFDPNAFFDTAAYAAANPDVVAAEINPYFHLLQFGEDEAAGALVVQGDGQAARSAGVDGVNLDIYAVENPDVAALVESGASSLLQHFLQFGRFEERPGTFRLDDVGSTAGTASAIDIGPTRIAIIERSGDDDWFAVELRSGVSYVMRLEGLGTENPLEDPFLRVFAPDGRTLIGGNDDESAFSEDAALLFTPETTGVYFLSARASDDVGDGNYGLTVLDAFSGAPPIDLVPPPADVEETQIIFQFTNVLPGVVFDDVSDITGLNFQLDLNGDGFINAGTESFFVGVTPGQTSLSGLAGAFNEVIDISGVSVSADVVSGLLIITDALGGEFGNASLIGDATSDPLDVVSLIL